MDYQYHLPVLVSHLCNTLHFCIPSFFLRNFLILIAFTSYDNIDIKSTSTFSYLHFFISLFSSFVFFIITQQRNYISLQRKVNTLHKKIDFLLIFEVQSAQIYINSHQITSKNIKEHQKFSLYLIKLPQFFICIFFNRSYYITNNSI